MQCTKNRVVILMFTNLKYLASTSWTTPVPTTTILSEIETVFVVLWLEVLENVFTSPVSIIIFLC